jgi:hypothetical protein
MKLAVEEAARILIDAYLAGLAACELSEESVFKSMGSHLTIKMMDEVCSVLDETKRILQYTRAVRASPRCRPCVAVRWPR